MIYQYTDEKNRTRVAVVLSVARKWMRIGVIEGGKLKVMRVPITEREYFSEQDRGAQRVRKENASLRRLAKQKGVSGKVRKEVMEALKGMDE